MGLSERVKRRVGVSGVRRPSSRGPGIVRFGDAGDVSTPEQINIKVTAIAAVDEFDAATPIRFEGREYRVAIVRVTPEIAGRWLERNRRNRTISKDAAKRYARAIKDRRWIFNGEPIVFDDAGDLVNGQHRLTSCVESGETFPTLVVWGVEPDALTTMDKARRRSNMDDLSIAGESHSRILASAVAHLFRMDCGDVASTLKVESYDVRDFIDREPHVRESCVTGRAADFLLPDSWAAALHHAMWRKAPERADEFWRKLIGGIGLAPGDAIYALRERCIKARGAFSRNKLIRDTFAIAIKAFNAWRSGKPTKELRFRDGEKFPEID